MMNNFDDESLFCVLLNMRIFVKLARQFTEAVTDLWLEAERLMLDGISKVLPPSYPDPAECEHQWSVEEVIHSEVALGVICWKCMSTGKVLDPTEEEWMQAYRAPSKPYSWDEASRVNFGKQFSE